MKRIRMTFGRFRIAATLGLVLFALSLVRSAGGTDTLPLKTIADIRLEGRTTRLDYQAYDPARHLLFIAHLGDSALIVVDLAVALGFGEPLLEAAEARYLKATR